MSNPLTVFFDGACPLCRREIAFYRRLRGAERIAWVDVSAAQRERIGPDLCRSDALARFHVRLPDGRLADGARAFAELWAALPGFRWLGRLARTRMAAPLLEAAYRGFLRIRPALGRLVARFEPDARHRDRYPRWLERELRSDHAGETGAVAIYRGILALSRSPEVRDFATRHVETETRHLALMDELVEPSSRSRLVPIWRAAGFVTGALPALAGPRAVYATIDAVETFVDHHYRAQIEAIGDDPQWRALRDALESCRLDEISHRDEARRQAPQPRGVALRAWTRIVGIGSAAGVAIARRL